MSNDILDVRDLVSEYETLESDARDEFDGLMRDDADFGETYTDDDDGFEAWLDEQERDDNLKELKALLSELKGYGGDVDWRGDWYPLLLIEEDSFTDYCRELLQDCGDIPSDLPWFIERNIDWDGVASDMKQDYSEVEFNGETYFYR